MLAREYPAMFHNTEGSVPSYTGYGLGGLKGLKNLPERICNMVFTFWSFNERLNSI